MPLPTFGHCLLHCILIMRSSKIYSGSPLRMAKQFLDDFSEDSSGTRKEHIATL